MAIVDEGVEIVVGHDIQGYGTNGDVHVSVVTQLHGHAKVKILDVTHHAVPTIMETTLLKRSLAMMRSAVLVLTLLVYSTWSPPTVQQT